MNKAKRWFVLFAMVSFSPVLAACSSGSGGHSVDLGGVSHRDGSTDPVSNCVGCHGSDLHGGDGPNCYSCHSNSDHHTSFSGVMHNQSDVDCTRCHDPTRTQSGLGPACASSGCHSA